MSVNNISKVWIKIVILSFCCVSSIVWAAQEDGDRHIMGREIDKEIGREEKLDGSEEFNLGIENEFYHFMTQSDEDIRHVLGRINKGPTPLTVAAQLEDEESVKRLLDLKADPNKEDSTGQTPLCAAASRQYAKRVVRLLIAAGANVNQPNRGKETPLECALRGASRQRDNDVLEQLIKARANVNAPTHFGMSLLRLAIDQFPDVRLEEARTFVAAGATVGDQELAAAQKKADQRILDLLHAAPITQKTGAVLLKELMAWPYVAHAASGAFVLSLILCVL